MNGAEITWSLLFIKKGWARRINSLWERAENNLMVFLLTNVQRKSYQLFSSPFEVISTIGICSEQAVVVREANPFFLVVLVICRLEYSLLYCYHYLVVVSLYLRCSITHLALES